ncbi:MAG TPA: hypothetical protein HA362_01955 [Nanoarchaeota archaeon]|nr:hypothetical protein [Nanoarchaeota archaeon]
MNIPKTLLKTKYRKEMWANSQRIIKKLEKVLPVSSVYLRGSFTTKKERPADVDFIVLLQTKESRQNSKWSVDFVVAPENKYGNLVLKDAEQWMKQKYGSKKTAVIKLK